MKEKKARVEDALNDYRGRRLKKVLFPVASRLFGVPFLLCLNLILKVMNKSA